MATNPITRFATTLQAAIKSREVMGVIIDDTPTRSALDRVKKPTALVKEVRPNTSQGIKGDIVARMAIAPAPRKSGGISPGDEKPASDGRTIGPPDALITASKTGLGKIILIGVAVLTLIMIMGGRKS